MHDPHFKFISSLTAAVAAKICGGQAREKRERAKNNILKHHSNAWSDEFIWSCSRRV